MYRCLALMMIATDAVIAGHFRYCRLYSPENSRRDVCLRRHGEMLFESITSRLQWHDFTYIRIVSINYMRQLCPNNFSCQSDRRWESCHIKWRRMFRKYQNSREIPQGFFIINWFHSVLYPTWWLGSNISYADIWRNLCESLVLHFVEHWETLFRICFWFDFAQLISQQYHVDNGKSFRKLSITFCYYGNKFPSPTWKKNLIWWCISCC